MYTYVDVPVDKEIVVAAATDVVVEVRGLDRIPINVAFGRRVVTTPVSDVDEGIVL